MNDDIIFAPQISPTNCVCELEDADSINHVVIFLTGQVLYNNIHTTGLFKKFHCWKLKMFEVIR